MKYSPCAIRLLKKQQIRQISQLLITIVVFEFLLFPMPILASSKDEVKQSGSLFFSLEVNGLQPRELIGHRWSLKEPIKEMVVEEVVYPPEEIVEIISTSQHVITAYNSLVAQCDDTPCITASGFNLCEHNTEDSVAANFLPMGAKIRIPELFGDRVFIVRDRMNRRHHSRVDVWMKEYRDAVQFGIRVAVIEVIK